MSDDVLKEVDSLLKEKERFQAWLQRLEERRAQTNERSFERVRADYLKRLEEVADKLKAHSDVVRERLGEVGQKAVDLEVEKANRGDELEEARLRHEVGEYAEETEWSELEGQLQESLEEAEGKLATAQTEVARLKEIVTQLAGGEPSPAAEPEGEPEPQLQAEPAPEPEALAELQAEAIEAISGLEESASAEAGPAAEDEGLVFLQELVGGDDESGLNLGDGSEGAEPATKESQPAAEEASGDMGDEMAFLESLSLDTGGESETFSFLEAQGRGTPQTIICPHCSAANDPVEWYCTECGEELPAE